MLGESHALVNEFPEFEQLITTLVSRDTSFSAQVIEYNRIDEEIRRLELKNAPISDTAMHEIKHQRALLKDKLYHLLKEAS